MTKAAAQPARAPLEGRPDAEPPDPLPARMLNEFVYCPRLFYYEWVEKVFVASADTREGAARHRRVEAPADALPAPESAAPERIHSRSIELASPRLGLIAKLDLIESEPGSSRVTPVDYKKGRPRDPAPDADTGPEPWPADRAQITAQVLILRDNGYECPGGDLYYIAVKQRLHVVVDAAAEAELVAQIAAARAAAAGAIPPPLLDSPKCPRCSLVGVCLPDETNALRSRLAALETAPAPLQLALFPSSQAAAPPTPVRPLIVPRDDQKPLYLNTQGWRVGKSGDVLQIRGPAERPSISKSRASRDARDELKLEARLGEVSQINLLGNVQLSTQVIQACCEAEIPISFFSQGGFFYGLASGFGPRNAFLRRAQFFAAENPALALALARRLVAGKIRNQRVMLLRNHLSPPAEALVLLRALAREAEFAPSLESLLGLEGAAARAYFVHFSGLIKADDPQDHALGASADAPMADGAGADPGAREDALADAIADPGLEPFAPPERRPPARADGVSAAPSAAAPASPATAPAQPPSFRFDFQGRNRRPPRDPVNALLSLAYSLLAKDAAITCLGLGLDPHWGFYHQPRFGRPALALDLMEPFRPLIADSAVLQAINTGMVRPRDFVRAGPAVALRPDGRRAFYHAYELRMDAFVTHPLFDYRVSYRRMLEIQTRLLARFLTGEIPDYPVFVTR